MICSKCGKSNSDNFRFCQYCGTPTGKNPSSILKALSIPGDSPEVSGDIGSELDSLVLNGLNGLNLDAHASDSIQSNDDMPKMSITSRVSAPADTAQLIEQDDDSADHEDAPAQSAPPHTSAPRVCSACGAEIPDGHKFCGNCGNKYDENAVIAPRPDSLTDLTAAGERNTARRVVNRVSFIDQSVTAAAPDTCSFALYHINDDGSLGDEIPLSEGENIIGRSSSVALSGDRFISPKHVRITCRGNEAVVEDCGSLNGVFQRLTDVSAEIFDGDAFRVGEELLIYSKGDSQQAILTHHGDDSTHLLGSKEITGWGYLRVILGPFSEGSVFRLAKPSVSIGRTMADILFPRDGFVSGTHASIAFDGEKTILSDLNSSNGTFLRFKKPAAVTDTMHFLIGNQLLRLTTVHA